MTDTEHPETGLPTEDGTYDPTEPGGRNLPVAIATGVAMAAVMLTAMFWDPLAFTILIALLALVGIIEAGRVLRPVGVPLSVPVLVVATLVIVFGAYRGGAPGQVVGLVTLFLGSVAWLLADAGRRDVVATLGATLLVGLWVPFLASFGVLLVSRPADGPVAALAVLGGAIFTDIGGYALGSRFGRHKIAPSISPAKSWEGLVGGLVTAGLVGALVLPQIGDAFSLPAAIIVPMLTGLAGFFGDLTESMIKRDLGIKDIGALIPGHGGVLDRVDGILLALPVGYLILEVAI